MKPEKYGVFGGFLAIFVAWKRRHFSISHPASFMWLMNRRESRSSVTFLLSQYQLAAGCPVKIEFFNPTKTRQLLPSTLFIEHHFTLQGTTLTVVTIAQPSRDFLLAKLTFCSSKEDGKRIFNHFLTHSRPVFTNFFSRSFHLIYVEIAAVIYTYAVKHFFPRLAEEETENPFRKSWSPTISWHTHTNSIGI